MIVTRTIAETRAALRSLPRPLGFAPTMGALHEGHLSLVDAAKARCASVAGSVFVNPTQFGQGEDFAAYPRDEARDFALFEERGLDLVFAPAAAEMYPDGSATGVHVARAASPKATRAPARPGHFDGMALVVTKLLDIVQPDVLFLGEKDAQQLAVVRRFVRDLDLPVEVAGVPTVREPDGLAMSSRNAYLTPEQRAVAPDLYRALLAGRAAQATHPAQRPRKWSSQPLLRCCCRPCRSTTSSGSRPCAARLRRPPRASTSTTWPSWTPTRSCRRPSWGRAPC